jgi:hypothetical protein
MLTVYVYVRLLATICKALEYVYIAHFEKPIVITAIANLSVAAFFKPLKFFAEKKTRLRYQHEEKEKFK